MAEDKAVASSLAAVEFLVEVGRSLGFALDEDCKESSVWMMVEMELGKLLV